MLRKNYTLKMIYDKYDGICMGQGPSWVDGNAILRADPPPLMPIRVSVYDGRSYITDVLHKTGVCTGMMYA